MNMSEAQDDAARGAGAERGRRSPGKGIPAAAFYIIGVLGLVLAILVVAGRIVSLRRDVQTRFQQSLIEVKSNQGDVLEVATCKTAAQFFESDKLDTSVIGITLPLGTTEAWLSVPVTYRFHVLLSDRWQITTTPELVTIIAPRIRPSLPPAPDISAMEVKTQRGWARLNEKEVEDRARSMVTGQLNLRAHEVARSLTVRDAARSSIEEALRKYIKWLPDECRDKTFVVKFVDERDEGERPPVRR